MPAQVNGHPLWPLHRTFAAVRRLAPDRATLAIAWLHLKHPLLPIQQKLLAIRDTPPATAWVECAGGVLSAWAYALHVAIRVLRIRMQCRRERAALYAQPFDMALKTWGFGADLAAKPADFYYGDWAQRLESQGIRTLLISGDAGKLGGLAFARHYTSSGPLCRLAEQALLSPSDSFRAALAQSRAAFRLRRLAARARHPRLKATLYTASRSVCAPQTLRDMLQYDMAATAVRHWKLRFYGTLYEGHGWEKCAWWGAKEASPACETLGYQHTVIFPEALAMLRPIVDLRSRSLPDRVLTIGQIPLELLQPTHVSRQCALDVLGSFRYQAASTTQPSPADRAWILVTPEGLPEEMIAMFRFSHRAAKAMRQATFVIRTHPAAPLETVLKDLPADFLQVPNLVISREKDIAADFARCSFLLYRGSSTVLYGILQGLRPLYLHVPGAIDTDPLYNLNLWRLACSTEADVAVALEQEPKLDPVQRGAEWRAAADYVNRYTMPFQATSLSRFRANA